MKKFELQQKYRLALANGNFIEAGKCKAEYEQKFKKPITEEENGKEKIFDMFGDIFG